MIKPYSILMQKSKEAQPMKDSLSDFGMVCTGLKMPDLEIKELPENEWNDEDGKDVYYPDTSFLKEYEFQIGVASREEGCMEFMDYFLSYVTGKSGDGVEMLLYIPHYKLGRACRVSGVKNIEFFLQDKYEVLTFDLIMRVDSPRMSVLPLTDDDGVIVGLKRV